jgi:hypothetical protein
MNAMRESFVDRIRNRLRAAEADAVLAAIDRAAANQVFHHVAARQTAELVAHYKSEARYAIRQYRLWQYREAVRALLEPLHEAEGRHLLDAARGAATLYLDARQDYAALLAACALPDEDPAADQD